MHNNLHSLLNKSEALLPIIIGVVLGVFILNYLLEYGDNNVDLELFALGNETSKSISKVDNIAIHCDGYIDAGECTNGYKSTATNNVLLWLGNSQIHSINQMKSGDETAVPILHKLLKKRKKYLVAFSQPNANLQEHYVLFEYLKTQLPVKTLILPVVFDDMRETGIRDDLSNILKLPEVSARLLKMEIGDYILNTNNKSESAGSGYDALDSTPQKRVEKKLDAWVGMAWPLWEKRSSIRGKIFIFLYEFRNWVFGINPSSIRKLIPGRYILNQKALSAILAVANESNINVLMYNVPLRNDIISPYDPEQYSKFKEYLSLIASKYNARYVDFDSLVPGKYWGTKESQYDKKSEIDFMHFQFKGHKLLADALFSEIIKKNL